MMKRMAALLLAVCLSFGAAITAFAEGWQKSGTEWTYTDEDGKKVRNDRDIKRDYIRGRYGAIPFIGK